jgi:crossover junction endodeoxyribonuclease RusA
MIEIALPWPPSVNHYKTVGRIVRTQSGQIFQKRVNSPETKRFYYEVWLRIAALKAKEGVKFLDSATNRLEVVLTAHPPDNRRRDLDNLLKVSLDSLVNGGLIHDDSLIDRLLIERKAIIPHGQVIVRIMEIVDEPEPD